MSEASHGVRIEPERDRTHDDDDGPPAIPLAAPASELREPEGGALMRGPLETGEKERTPEADPAPPAQDRALVPLGLGASGHHTGERLIAFAYRLGVPPELLGSPPKRKGADRLRAEVEAPALGHRPAGMALRAGHFLVAGVKAPIGKVDFAPTARLTPPFEDAIHGFAWLDDLALAGSPDQTGATARRILAQWLAANPKPARGTPWSPGAVGSRLMAWLIHAPLLAREASERTALMEAIRAHAAWLDRHAARGSDPVAALCAWSALTAAGLLLPDGRPRRLFAEGGLVRAGGNLVSDDGGTLSRSPLDQIRAIAALSRLDAVYRAVRRDPPEGVGRLQALLVPPLLALRHADGGLGSWQGGGGLASDRVETLIAASGVRARPLADVRDWGYQRARAGDAILQFDAAPPPLAKHAQHGCASTLAFELSIGPDRLIVNCGGAGLAGGQVPIRIEQGLRATAAHSTLVLDETNSTAVLIKGRLGTGVREVEVDRRGVGPEGRARGGTRIEASHDGYVARNGLIHRRILTLRGDGGELVGDDILEPAGKRGKRGTIGFAIRFHLGRGVAIALSEDRRGAQLALPSGAAWQFRLAGTEEVGELTIEESLWIDGEGRAHPIEQLVVQGMARRAGSRFSWLLRRMD